MLKKYNKERKEVELTNSISIIYVPKTSCTNNVKWFDDSKLIRIDKIKNS